MGIIADAVAASFAVTQAAHGQAATYHRGDTSVDVTAIPSNASWAALEFEALNLQSDSQAWLVAVVDLAELTPAKPLRGDQLRLASGSHAGRYDVLPEANTQTYRRDPTGTFYEVLTKAAPRP